MPEGHKEAVMTTEQVDQTVVTQEPVAAGQVIGIFRRDSAPATA
jgi:hypothetical protein